MERSWILYNKNYNYRSFLFILIIVAVTCVTRFPYCTAENSGLILTKEGIYENAVVVAPHLIKRISNKLFNNTIPDKVTDFFAPINAVNEVCRNESSYYKTNLRKFETWALKTPRIEAAFLNEPLLDNTKRNLLQICWVWDSSGKIPAGMMHSNFFDLGNYLECLEVPEIGPFPVKYCLIRIGGWAELWNTGFDWANKETIYFGSARVMKPEFYLGRCVPASCNNNDLISHFSDYVKDYNFTIRLDEYSCTASDESYNYTLMDWSMLGFLAVTVFLLLVSTIVDLILPKNEPKGIFTQILLCFSLDKNARKLLSRADETRSLRALYGLRACAMILIMWAHIAANLGSTPKINFLPLIQDQFKPTFRLAFVSACNKAVDVFFVISGLLLSYMFIFNKKEGKKFNIILYYLNRIIRIIPPYAVQIAMLITVLYKHFGDGPMWKHNWGIVRESCIKNWWTNLLFINNFVNQEEMCIATNWYLAVDTQLYIIAPLLIFPLIKSHNFRKFGIPLLIVFFDSYTFYVSYINEYRAGSILDHDARTERTNAFLYISTHGRVSCWLLGLYLGYYLHNIDLKNFKKIPKWMLWTFWIGTVIMPLLEIGFMMYFMSDHLFINIVDALYHGYTRTMFAMAICWIILACETGYGGVVQKVLSSYPMQVLGRLTFSAYLVQEAILYGIDSTTLTTLQYHTFRETREGTGNLVAGFGVAFVYYLAFEAPYVNLGKLAIAGKEKPEPDTELKPKVNGKEAKQTTLNDSHS